MRRERQSPLSHLSPCSRDLHTIIVRLSLPSSFFFSFSFHSLEFRSFWAVLSTLYRERRLATGIFHLFSWSRSHSIPLDTPLSMKGIGNSTYSPSCFAYLFSPRSVDRSYLPFPNQSSIDTVPLLIVFVHFSLRCLVVVEIRPHQMIAIRTSLLRRARREVGAEGTVELRLGYGRRGML